MFNNFEVQLILGALAISAVSVVFSAMFAKTTKSYFWLRVATGFVGSWASIIGVRTAIAYFNVDLPGFLQYLPLPVTFFVWFAFLILVGVVFEDEDEEEEAIEFDSNREFGCNRQCYLSAMCFYAATTRYISYQQPQPMSYETVNGTVIEHSGIESWGRRFTHAFKLTSLG